MEEEYELIPMSPIRRLEKRLSEIEKSKTSGEILDELMGIIKTNQQVVDHMAKTNSAMIDKIVDLSNSVDKLMKRIDNFIERIETTEPAEAEEKEADKKLEERLEKMEKRLNAVLLSSMAKSKMMPQRQMQPQVL
jgi:uncharacterized coiled-coil protein SlyX